MGWKLMCFALSDNRTGRLYRVDASASKPQPTCEDRARMHKSRLQSACLTKEALMAKRTMLAALVLAAVPVTWLAAGASAAAGAGPIKIGISLSQSGDFS